MLHAYVCVCHGCSSLRAPFLSDHAVYIPSLSATPQPPRRKSPRNMGTYFCVARRLTSPVACRVLQSIDLNAKLFRYLEINSWMWEVNGLNLLVDPLFGTLDFGLPAFLLQASKPVRGVDRLFRWPLFMDSAAINSCFATHCYYTTACYEFGAGVRSQ